MTDIHQHRCQDHYAIKSTPAGDVTVCMYCGAAKPPEPTLRTTGTADFEERVAKSSHVSFVQYDAEKHELGIVFRNSKKPALHVYLNFPPEVFDEMLAAPSVGRFVHQRIVTPRENPPYRFEKRELPEGFVPAAVADQPTVS